MPWNSLILCEEDFPYKLERVVLFAFSGRRLSNHCGASFKCNRSVEVSSLY